MFDPGVLGRVSLACGRGMFSLEFEFEDCLTGPRKSKSVQLTVNSGAHISVSQGSYETGQMPESFPTFTIS